jgi:hypothetical protein
MNPPVMIREIAYDRFSVIPTGAERSEAQWRDLFCRCVDKRRSLDCAALRAAPLGMTVV